MFLKMSTFLNNIFDIILTDNYLRIMSKFICDILTNNYLRTLKQAENNCWPSNIEECLFFKEPLYLKNSYMTYLHITHRIVLHFNLFESQVNLAVQALKSFI